MANFVPKRLRSWVRCLTPGLEEPCAVEERWLIRRKSVRGAFINAVSALKRAGHWVISRWPFRLCLEELLAAWNRVPWGVHPTLRTLVYKCLQERPTNAWRSIPNMELTLPLVKIRPHKVQTYAEMRHQFRDANNSWTFPQNPIPNWGIDRLKPKPETPESVRVTNPQAQNNLPSGTTGPRIVQLRWGDSSVSSTGSELSQSCFNSDYSDQESDGSESDNWGL